MIKVPDDLVDTIQYSLIGEKYKDGIYVFSTLKESDIISIVASFIKWCDENGLIKDNRFLDLELFLERNE